MKSRDYAILGILSFILLLTFWSLLTYTGLIKPFFLPTPDAVIGAGIRLFTEESFTRDVLISLFRIFTGFIIATILAIPLGIIIGLNKKAEAFLEPVIDFIRYTPIPAFIPLFILWFGIGETEKIVVISASVFFQLVLMVANSVSLVPKEMVEFAKTLGAKNEELILKIIYQYAKPRIWDDLRISMGWAWSGLMLAEIVGSTSGIGFVIIQSQRLLQTENVIFAIIVVGVLGLLIDLIFKIFYTALFPWSEKEKV